MSDSGSKFLEGNEIKEVSEKCQGINRRDFLGKTTKLAALSLFGVVAVDSIASTPAALNNKHFQAVKVFGVTGVDPLSNTAGCSNTDCVNEPCINSACTNIGCQNYDNCTNNNCQNYRTSGCPCS